ncbi:MAG: periplasmic heavy metal sensor [Rhodospirillaceae bacterium]|nr:MAG: periplasmic heavy metal sensor [Rhodospirillaceae bacterium]
MTGTRTLIIAVVLTALAGAVGGWAGFQYGRAQAHHTPGLDDIVHHQLGLTADQESRLAVVEEKFSGNRESLESEMRAANHDLAVALSSEHVYGDNARQAIERFHRAMGMLQEQTVMHILAMREILTPEQATRFDKTVLEALSSDRS